MRHRGIRDATVGSLTTSNCRLVRLLPGVSETANGNTQKQYRASRQRGRDADEQRAMAAQQVYQPVNHLLYQILSSLERKSMN